MLLTILSKCLLNNGFGHWPVPQVSLQCLTILSLCFLMFSLNFPWHSFESCASCHWISGEEVSISLFTSPPKDAVENNKVSPQPPFLQTRQTQTAQPLIRHVFQPFHRLCFRPLNACKDLQILLKLWGPELHAVCQMRPQQCWIVGLFWLVDDAVFDEHFLLSYTFIWIFMFLMLVQIFLQLVLTSYKFYWKSEPWLHNCTILVQDFRSLQQN